MNVSLHATAHTATAAAHAATAAAHSASTTHVDLQKSR
jgi:hypothetical protein